MHSDLKILIEELQQIRDNNTEFKLTHSEIRTFIRAFIAALENSLIEPFSDFDYEESNKIIFYLNLIRAYGITHVDRSRMASRCLSTIESIESKKKMPADTQNDLEWDEIPF